jgi:hypothetical protein
MVDFSTSSWTSTGGPALIWGPDTDGDLLPTSILSTKAMIRSLAFRITATNSCELLRDAKALPLSWQASYDRLPG